MSDYYDRVEAQLAALTERGAHRRRRARIALPRLRFGGEWAAVAASLLIVVVVGAAILGIRASRRQGASSKHTVARSTSSATSSAARVPNPFRVIARYSASSLGLRGPANLAIGPDGNLYIPDASQRVTVVSPQGRVLRRWGRPGKGPGELDFVKHQPGVPQVSAGIAVGADGRVYVDDSGNARVEVFSPTGTFIRQFGGHGYGRRQILFSNYLAADGQGDVYLADDQKKTTSKYSPTGALDWVIGGASATDPDLIGHFHISSSSIDPHARLLIANDDRSRILYIDGSGHKVDAFGSLRDFKDGPCDVTVDAADNTYVNSCQEPLQSPHYTEVFDRTHRLIGKWYPSPFAFSPRFGPRGEVLALGEDGSILRLRIALAGA